MIFTILSMLQLISNFSASKKGLPRAPPSRRLPVIRLGLAILRLHALDQ